MNNREDNIDYYLRAYPYLLKWINQCFVCGNRGHKPEMPEQISPDGCASSRNIKKYLSALYVNELSICELCEQLTNLK